MKKNLIAFVLLFLPCVVFASPQSQLIQYLGGYSTYSADFKQTTLNDQKQLQQQSSGQVTIQRPGRLRWEVMSPQRELMVINGKTLWRYDPGLAQATKQTVGQSHQQFNPAFLLSSKVGSIIQQFDVALVKLKGEAWYRLTPKQNQAASFKDVYLNFAHGKISKLMVINNLGERSLFRFTHVVTNQAVDAQAFQFKPPKGVDVDVQ